ncbi:MAG: hypothetical protein ACOY7P_13740, partial [Pseudomonadota bacterium]
QATPFYRSGERANANQDTAGTTATENAFQATKPLRSTGELVPAVVEIGDSSWDAFQADFFRSSMD